MLDEFIAQHKVGDDFKATAQQWYIPLAEKIAALQQKRQCIYLGVNGCQGSGKSTLSDFLSCYLRNQYQLNTVALSLDDFYLSQTERQQLAKSIHPLFKTRGVPGTHDTQVLSQTLSQLRQNGAALRVPSFDKSLDNPKPCAQWPQVTRPIDVLIVEGWCWGVEAQEPSALSQAINTLEQQQDSDGVWRRYVNEQLQSCYQPLYDQMDYWVMLKAPSFKQVFTWRLEQEQKLVAHTGNQGSGLMSEQQIYEFIQYFQRLTEHSLKTMPNRCDQVFELDQYRQIINATAAP
ncbi:MAG: kinase [Alteromonadaceae bacterium]|nr:MAG: kinase [Alteromonadaceae bacterium]